MVPLPTLSNFELMVMLAIIRIGDDFYGVSISNEIEEATAGEVLLGSVYDTLARQRGPGIFLNEVSMIRHIVIRIALWASVGFLISTGWGFYFANTDKANPINPSVYVLIYASQPIAGITHSYFDFPRGLRAVEIENAVTYALIGLILEPILRRHRLIHV
jgi:hypothetical protein